MRAIISTTAIFCLVTSAGAYTVERPSSAPTTAPTTQPDPDDELIANYQRLERLAREKLESTDEWKNAAAALKRAGAALKRARTDAERLSAATAKLKAKTVIADLYESRVLDEPEVAAARQKSLDRAAALDAAADRLQKQLDDADKPRRRIKEAIRDGRLVTGMTLADVRAAGRNLVPPSLVAEGADGTQLYEVYVGKQQTTNFFGNEHKRSMFLATRYLATFQGGVLVSYVSQ